MKALVIYWDPHQDYQYLVGGAKRWLSSYIFSMEAFGFDTLYVVGTPGINHGYNIQHKEYASLEEILDLHPEANIVSMVGSVPEGVVPVDLVNFVHPPENVLYIIGGDYSDIQFEILSKYESSYVHIDGIIDQNNFWSNVVAGIVTRDRYLSER